MGQGQRQGYIYRKLLYISVYNSFNQRLKLRTILEYPTILWQQIISNVKAKTMQFSDFSFVKKRINKQTYCHSLYKNTRAMCR